MLHRAVKLLKKAPQKKRGTNPSFDKALTRKGRIDKENLNKLSNSLKLYPS